ncbi:ribose transport system substrate-binding protein [Lentibacillus halodurans]|uniref:Ribose transport system substrate-binding protein n=1 Tax=Lentibacillus halodurans TaxID=237679 RepID=A0A1I0XMS4_9BACI|nr:sugar-binding protein [Lentibacillus halodurans]SFB01736.1 ribose transport system substrate-binding protein [Lentibacillus halodurans]
MSNSKLLLYTLSGVVFCISLIGMVIYGYKTFFIQTEKVESADYSYHFALIAEEADNEYWRQIEKGAKEAAAKHNIYLEYLAPTRANNDKLLKLLDRMISAKVDGIIVQGVQGERFVDLVHKAVEREIPIITVDSDVPNSERKAYVGTDNFQAGKLAGKALIDNTTGEQYVGIVTGRFNAINQQQRLKGFKEAIKDTPRIHVVDIEESNITSIGAAQATYSLLKQYPLINMFLGTSALDGIGIVDGIEEIAANEDFTIIGFDLLPETIHLLQEGAMNATIAQYPNKMGKKSVNVLFELQEQDILDDKIYTDTRIIEKGDLPPLQEGEIQ